MSKEIFLSQLRIGVNSGPLCAGVIGDTSSPRFSVPTPCTLHPTPFTHSPECPGASDRTEEACVVRQALSQVGSLPVVSIQANGCTVKGQGPDLRRRDRRHLLSPFLGPHTGVFVRARLRERASVLVGVGV